MRLRIPEYVLPAIVWFVLVLLLLALSTVKYTPFEERVRKTYGENVSLAPDLWLPTLRADPERLVRVGELDTKLPLASLPFVFGTIELALGAYYARRAKSLILPLIRAAGVFLVLWSFFGHEPFWDFVLHLVFPSSPQLLHPTTTVIQFVSQHLELLVASSLIIIPLGVGLGILITRENFREFLPLVNNLINNGQTVPTLAVIAIVAPVIGFGFWPAILALILYGLLPVVRNTIVGLESVDRFIIESAQGMGMSPSQSLYRIEIPIASQIIMAGIRTSIVINVGTAALGAFIGSGGLGVPIASGLSMTIDPFVLLGALPAALLAILLDYVLGEVELVLTPRGLRIEA